MVRRVLLLGGVLVALVGVAVGLAISFQERIAPPPPPPLSLPSPGPESPELATLEDGVALEVAGIRIRLPRGSRIHPSRVQRTTEVVRVEARTGALHLGVTFYTQDHGILGEPYQAALAGPVEDEGLRRLLFGEDRPVLREQHQRPGGHVLRFDMSPAGRRHHRSLLVARPKDGGALATVTVEYSFQPKAARDVAALPEAIEFL